MRSVSAASSATFLEIKSALTWLSFAYSADQNKSFPSTRTPTSAFLAWSIVPSLCASESFLLTSSGVIVSAYGMSDLASAVGASVAGAIGVGVMIAAGLGTRIGDGTDGDAVFDALNVADEVLSNSLG